MTEARREYVQLLRLYDRVRKQLQTARDELESPGIQKLMKEIRKRTGDEAEEGIAETIRAVEDALRTIQISESEIQVTLRSDDAVAEVEGIDNLPARLGRFLAERDQLPGFSYEVERDEVRGWIVKWREYTHDGRIRGYGQFYERPYAWLDD